MYNWLSTSFSHSTLNSFQLQNAHSTALNVLHKWMWTIPDSEICTKFSLLWANLHQLHLWGFLRMIRWLEGEEFRKFRMIRWAEGRTSDLYRGVCDSFSRYLRTWLKAFSMKLVNIAIIVIWRSWDATVFVLCVPQCWTDLDCLAMCVSWLFPRSTARWKCPGVPWPQQSWACLSLTDMTVSVSAARGHSLHPLVLDAESLSLLDCWRTMVNKCGWWSVASSYSPSDQASTNNGAGRVTGSTSIVSATVPRPRMVARYWAIPASCFVLASNQLLLVISLLRDIYMYVVRHAKTVA